MSEEPLSPTRPKLPPLKRGRKPRYYKAPWGEVIVGLTRGKGGRWRVRSVLGRDITFNEEDPKKAIERFRHLEEEAKVARYKSEFATEFDFFRVAKAKALDEEKIYIESVADQARQSAEVHEYLDKMALWIEATQEKLNRFYIISNDDACKRVRNLIVSDPVFVAKHLGVSGKLLKELLIEIENRDSSV